MEEFGLCLLPLEPGLFQTVKNPAAGLYSNL